MDRMIVNLSLNLKGNLAEIKEWIDSIDSTIVVESKISRTTKFAEATEESSSNLNLHYQRIDLKLNVPIETDSFGRRMCPMNACAKYIDELMHCRYLRLASRWAKKHNEPYELHKDELELTFWKPKTNWNSLFGNQKTQSVHSFEFIFALLYRPILVSTNTWSFPIR